MYIPLNPSLLYKRGSTLYRHVFVMGNQMSRWDFSQAWDESESVCFANAWRHIFARHGPCTQPCITVCRYIIVFLFYGQKCSILLYCYCCVVLCCVVVDIRVWFDINHEITDNYYFYWHFNNPIINLRKNNHYPASILCNSIASRYRPVSSLTGVGVYSYKISRPENHYTY